LGGTMRKAGEMYDCLSFAIRVLEVKEGWAAMRVPDESLAPLAPAEFFRSALSYFQAHASSARLLGPTGGCADGKCYCSGCLLFRRACDRARGRPRSSG
jgi:hypothetical protein